MDTYLNKWEVHLNKEIAVLFKKFVSIAVITAFIFTLSPIPLVQATHLPGRQAGNLRNPQAKNTPVLAGAIGGEMQNEKMTWLSDEEIDLENNVKVFIPIRKPVQPRGKGLLFTDDDILFVIKVISMLNHRGVTPSLIINENSDIDRFNLVAEGMKLKYEILKISPTERKLIINDIPSKTRELERGGNWTPIIVEQASRFTVPYIPQRDIGLLLDYTTSTRDPLVIVYHGFSDFTVAGDVELIPETTVLRAINVYSETRPANKFFVSDPAILSGFLYDPLLIDLVEKFNGSDKSKRSNDFVYEAIRPDRNDAKTKLQGLLKNTSFKAVFHQGGFPNKDYHRSFFGLLGENFRRKKDKVVVFTFYDTKDEEEKDFVDWHKQQGHNFLDLSKTFEDNITESNITVVNLPGLSLLDFRKLLLASDIAAVTLENHLMDLIYLVNKAKDSPLPLFYPANESRLAVLTGPLFSGQKYDTLKDIYSYLYKDGGRIRTLLTDRNERKRFIKDIREIAYSNVKRPEGANSALINSANVVCNIVRLFNEGKNAADILSQEETKAARSDYKPPTEEEINERTALLKKWNGFVHSERIILLSNAERMLTQYRRGLDLDDEKLTKKLNDLTAKELSEEEWPSIKKVSGPARQLEFVGKGGSFIAFKSGNIVAKYRYLHDNPFLERGYDFEYQDRYHHILNTILAAQTAHGYTLPENAYITPALLNKYRYLMRLVDSGNASLLEETPALKLRYWRRKEKIGTDEEKDVKPELLILQSEAMTLKDSLIDLLHEGKLDEAKKLIDEYCALVGKLWRDGVYVADLHLEGVGVVIDGKTNEKVLKVIDLGTCPPRRFDSRLPDTDELDYPRPIYDEIVYTRDNVVLGRQFAKEFKFDKNRYGTLKGWELTDNGELDEEKLTDGQREELQNQEEQFNKSLPTLKDYFRSKSEKEITLNNFIEFWATGHAELEKKQLVCINRHILEEWRSSQYKDARLEAVRQLKELGEEKGSLPHVDVDLHIHSNYSDGYSTPSAVVYEAYKHGLQAIAIADHNCVDGVLEALQAGEILDIEVIPAVELNTSKTGVEILGYFSDIERFKRDCSNGKFKWLEKIRNTEEERVMHMKSLLEEVLPEMGVSIEEIREVAGLGHIMLRDYKAVFLNKYGVMPEEALRKKGRAWRPPEGTFAPKEIISNLKKVGAVTVLSHPGKGLLYTYTGELFEVRAEEDAEKNFKTYIELLKQYGLGGIEVSYNDHTAEQVEFFARVAKEKGLITTCGSGYHGKNQPGIEIGKGQVNDIYTEGNIAPEYGKYEIVKVIKALGDQNATAGAAGQRPLWLLGEARQAISAVYPTEERIKNGELIDFSKTNENSNIFVSLIAGIANRFQASLAKKKIEDNGWEKEFDAYFEGAVKENPKLDKAAATVKFVTEVKNAHILSKVIYPFLERPLALTALEKMKYHTGIAPIAIVGNQEREVTEALGPNDFVYVRQPGFQEDPPQVKKLMAKGKFPDVYGTGYAASLICDYIPDSYEGLVTIIVGDAPLFDEEVMSDLRREFDRLVDMHGIDNVAGVVLCGRSEHPERTLYGREIIREDGSFDHIMEARPIYAMIRAAAGITDDKELANSYDDFSRLKEAGRIPSKESILETARQDPEIQQAVATIDGEFEGDTIFIPPDNEYIDISSRLNELLAKKGLYRRSLDGMLLTGEELLFEQRFNPAIYLLRYKFFKQYTDQIVNNNASREHYGTDLFKILNKARLILGVAESNLAKIEGADTIEKLEELEQTAMAARENAVGAAGVKYEKVENFTKEIDDAINTLEKNMPPQRRMSSDMLKEKLRNSKSIIFIARDTITGEIIGYMFGVPQVVVPETIPSTSQYGNTYIDQTFYEMSWQVLPSHQRKGIGTGLRRIFRDAVRNAGYSYFATHQNDDYDESWLKTELSERYRQGDELLEVKPLRGTDKPQQYVVIKLNRSDTGGAQVTATAGTAQRVAELTAAEIAEIKGRLIKSLAPYIEQGGYALLLHLEPDSDDAEIIESRLLELGFDSEHIITVDTAEKAEAYIDDPKYNIVCVVNRLTDVNLQELIAGLGVVDVSGNVASVVPDTARDLQIWL